MTFKFSFVILRCVLLELSSYPLTDTKLTQFNCVQSALSQDLFWTFQTSKKSVECGFAINFAVK